MSFDYNSNSASVDLAKIGLEWGYQGSYGIITKSLSQILILNLLFVKDVFFNKTLLTTLC